MQDCVDSVTHANRCFPYSRVFCTITAVLSGKPSLLHSLDVRVSAVRGLRASHRDKRVNMCVHR